jgi:hypothetical protein
VPCSSSFSSNSSNLPVSKSSPLNIFDPTYSEEKTSDPCVRLDLREAAAAMVLDGFGDRDSGGDGDTL